MIWLRTAGGWLKSAASAAWSLAVAWPRTTAALVAAGLLWWAHVADIDRKVAARDAHWLQRQVAADAAFEVERHKKREEVADYVLASQRINTDWLTVYNHVQRRIQADEAARIKEGPRYVTKAADARCIVPAGFLRHARDATDAANGNRIVARSDAAETVSSQAVELVERPSGVPLSAVDEWVQRFATVSAQWRERALMCDRWIDKQALQFNQPTKGSDP